jgi:hypothetical protein
MLVTDSDGIRVRCDKCSSQLIIASNPKQANLSRMPSGWLQLDATTHNCPLCARAAMASLRATR